MTAYWNYIKVEELLALQNGREKSDEHLSNDEVMFITIHQIDELWFKLVLRELIAVRDLFAQPVVPEQSLAAAVRGVRRMQEVLGHLASHFTLMETMTTRDYLDFRDKLGSASGFQSGQMREIEILLGLADADRVGFGEGTYLDALRDADGAPSSAFHRVQLRLADKPTLSDAIREWLYRTPIQGSIPGQDGDAHTVAAFIDEYCAIHERATRAVFEARADAARVRDRFEKEMATQSFLSRDEHRRGRARAHVTHSSRARVHRELSRAPAPRVAARGDRRDRGARAVVRHLPAAARAHGRAHHRAANRHWRIERRQLYRRDRAKYRVFREVWAVRTLLVRKGDLPALRRPEIYGFATGAGAGS